MPYFVISGKPDCPNFMHALKAAQHLSEKLPQFNYKKIEISQRDWPGYLATLNLKEKWHVTECPLIWKEISMWGGKKYLIGSLGQFWEYIYCYYNMESKLPKRQLTAIAHQNLEFFNQRSNNKNVEQDLVITICTHAQWRLPVLLYELLKADFVTSRKTTIKLFDIYAESMDALVELADNVNAANISDNLIETVGNVKDAFQNCDILIHIYDYRKLAPESIQDWLFRCQDDIIALSDALTAFCKPSLKVILNDFGPVCFMAGLLLQNCEKLNPYHVVAISSNLGISAIHIMSEKTGIPVRDIGSPPVWGQVGLSDYVDLKNTVYRAHVQRPFERALTASKDSTLPLGVIKTELRLMSYLLNTVTCEKILDEVRQKHIMGEIVLERPFILAKYRAVMDLLNLWMRKDYGDEIISLGVISNGSFGIPRGIFFSQPVKLHEKGMWLPYSQFPFITNESRRNIVECIKDALQHYGDDAKYRSSFESGAVELVENIVDRALSAASSNSLIDEAVLEKIAPRIHSEYDDNHDEGGDHQDEGGDHQDEGGDHQDEITL